MPVTRFIGDVHARFGEYSQLIKGCERSIQVGDFGLGFRKSPVIGPEHRFIRGNHDDPTLCKEHPNWIEDVSVRDGVYFLGGGLSIDRQLRVEGVSWWADEELSINQLFDAIDGFKAISPSVVVTHDCPETVADVIGKHRGYKLDFPSRTCRTLDSMFHLHQPKLWIFGHWHVSLDQVVNGTRFICLNELQTIDINLEEYT